MLAGHMSQPWHSRMQNRLLKMPASVMHVCKHHIAAGDAKHKVQCIRRLPRDSMAVLCGAIVLMRVDLRLQVPACHAI